MISEITLLYLPFLIVMIGVHHVMWTPHDNVKNGIVFLSGVTGLYWGFWLLMGTVV